MQLIHDDRAHDPAEQRRAYERSVFDRWGAGSAATVVFSDYVANAVADRRDVAGTRLHTVPLTSDLDPALVPPPVPASARRNFVLIGRFNPYKNIDVVLDAWQAHVTGSRWCGDDLVLFGDGPPITRALPRHTSLRSGSYRYLDVIGALSAAKGSIAHYRRASQSGVQVLSMQLGVTPIVSPVGALTEFQPPGCPPVGVDDVDGLASAFDELADPETAARQGIAATHHYARRFAVEHAAERLLNILTQVADSATAAPATRGRPVDDGAGAVGRARPGWRAEPRWHGDRGRAGAPRRESWPAPTLNPTWGAGELRCGTGRTHLA